MKATQQFALDPRWDGSSVWACDLPPLVGPFSIRSIFFKLAAGTSAEKVPFVKIQIGGVNFAFVFKAAVTIGTPSLLWFSAAQNVEYSVRTIVGVVGEVSMVAPLPPLVLDSQAGLSFGIEGGASDDVLTDATVMLDILE